MRMKIPKIGLSIITIPALFIIQMMIYTPQSLALDNPHIPSNTVNCGTCHTPLLPDWWTKQGQDGGLCGQCHNSAAAMGTDVTTHSSPTYGNVTLQCTDCHNPHYQRQSRIFKDQSYLYMGRISTVTPSAMTQDMTYPGATSWTADQWADILLIPDVRYPTFIYRILSNDGQTITINTGPAGTDTINLTYIKPGATFAVVYGKLVKESIFGKIVRFFRNTGQNSFADSDVTIDGICQVCHTKTKYFKSDGSVIQGAHAEPAGGNCTKDCHKHTEGFKGSCSSCHGFPPTTATIGGSTGLASPATGATNPLSPGAHAAHVTTRGMTCNVCHAGNTMPTVSNTIQMGFAVNAMNYSSWGPVAVTTGSFDGHTPLLSPYSFTSSNAGTTVSVSASYANTCSNLYCHGSTLTAGTKTNPSWVGGTAEAACGTCHGGSAYATASASPPTTGSHVTHASTAAGKVGLACNKCHNSTSDMSHVSGNVAWSLDTADSRIGASATYRSASSGSTGGLAPSATYGNCSSTYCHGTAVIQWGGALADAAECDSCHGGNANSTTTQGLGPMTLINHPDHMNQESVLGTNYECAQCHSTTVSAGNDRVITGTVHVNQTKDVSMLLGGTWTAGTQSCTSVYCHSSGKGTYANPPAWNSATALGCNGCHGTGNALGRPDYANTGAGQPNANSHSAHATAATDCTRCHNDTTDTGLRILPGATLHTDANRDVRIAAAYDGNGGTKADNYNSVTKTCSSVTCHNDGTGVYTAVQAYGNPVWGAAGGCNLCHGNTTYTGYRNATPLYPSGTPKPNAHVYHTDARTTPSGETQCKNCHASVTSTNAAIDGTTPADHASGAYNVVAGGTYKDGDNVGGAAVSVTTSYSYKGGSTGPSTCTNVSCHPTGTAGTKALSKTKWATTYACSDCHSFNQFDTNTYHHVNVTCTGCHPDHNVFSPMLNANSPGRAYSMLTDRLLSPVPGNPPATGNYTNTDFDNSLTNGGICVSCHNAQEWTKSTLNQKPDGTTKTPVISRTAYNTSAHNYASNPTSTFASTPSGNFVANCAKCHNAGIETTTFQNSTNKFKIHASPLRRLLASLGMTSPTDPEEEDFCYRCHHKTGDANPGGGPAKTVANSDYYGAVTNMSAASQDIFTVFGKANKHNIAGYSGLHKPSPTDETRTYLSAAAGKHVECDDCHNPHAAKSSLHTTNTAHVAARTNLIADSGPLTGADGVSLTLSTTNWGGVTGYPTTSSAATYEYQICFKCHSSYINFTNWGVDTGVAAWTDVALEFNTANYSYHPVVGAVPTSRTSPVFTSVVIGDSGKLSTATTTQLTDSTKTWATDQWRDWGVRISHYLLSATAATAAYNQIRYITGNTNNALTVNSAYGSTPDVTATTGTAYSIEYYAGRGTKAGTTVTDLSATKNFSLYLPSLVGYVAVVSNDGTTIAKGTVTSNTNNSFTVGAWTTMSTGTPADGTVSYYFSATGKTMMCSDCHSNDTVSSAAAQGPHGSSVKWMLKGRNKAWPTTLASQNGTGTGTGFQTATRATNDGTDNGLFCLNCHSTVGFAKQSNGVSAVRGQGTTAQVHFVDQTAHSTAACYQCHIMVPHGGKMSRFMGSNVTGGTMPARYAFNSTKSNMYVLRFTPAATVGGYGTGNCNVSACSSHTSTTQTESW